MQGSVRRRFALLLVTGWAVLTLSAPVHAIDCVKKTVNRTGEIQEEQLVTLFGPEQGEEFVLGEPFLQVQQWLLGGLELDTLFRYFDTGPAVRVIPPTNDLNPPIDSVVTTGFSVADHEFFILDWSWARWLRIDGVPFQLVPTQPVADPSIRFEGDAERRIVRLTLRNDTPRAVLILNARCSVGPEPDLKGDVTDFLHPGGVTGPDSPSQRPRAISSPNPRSFPGERGVMTIGDFVLPPFANGDIEFPVGIRSFDVPVPSTSRDLTLIFRCTLFRQGDVGLRNPAELAVWDQPFETYCPKLYHARAASGGKSVPGYANVKLYLDGRDPDGSIPHLALESLTPLDGQFGAGDVILQEVKREVVTDRMGRRIARICVHALLRRDECFVRYFRYGFRAKDAQGETARGNVTLWVNPE